MKKKKRNYKRRENFDIQINPIYAREIKAAATVYFYLQEHPQNQNGHIAALGKTITQKELRLLPLAFEAAMDHLKEIGFISYTCKNNIYDITVHNQ